MPIAESVGLAALRWVLSPVVKDLISKGTSYLGSDISKGLEDLETTLLPEFDLVIQAAQNSPHKHKLAKWLARWKKAYYDAEGILHDLEYERLKCKTKSQNKRLGIHISSHPVIKPLAKFTSKVNKKVSPVIKPLVKFTGKVSEKVSMLSPEKGKLWYRLNKLKNIAAEAKTFLDLLGLPTETGNSAKTVNGRPVTYSLLTHKVFGRDGDCNDIISFLLDEQESNSSRRGYTVIAITGIGGNGKTTLAQYVYNNEKVKEHYDSRRMWLCLSQNKTIEERTKEMIECITEEHPNLSNLSVLQNKLIKALPESKGVLLVLDDVWYDPKAGEEQWDDLLAPFVSRGGKCKIVVTSRSTSFPVALQPEKLIKLDNLAPYDFISLFRYYAIPGLEIANSQLEKDLSDIGDQIADKMSKSPLAAKVVGNQLRKKPNRTFWQATLENVNLSSTRGVLLWSYQCMDVQLQRCFLFCSIFPRGAWYTGDDLVQYWVALDFIEPSDDKNNLEDIGFRYFQMMVENSIFQLVDGKYVMHDLFCDLAENLSVGDCFRVTNFEREIPSTTLYLYLNVNNGKLRENLSIISSPRNLRALIVDIPFNVVEDVNKFFLMVSRNFKYLRVLDVWSEGYKTLPKVVGDLRNLRYLNVWQSSIDGLPDYVSRLYHLQFLILPTSVKTLPIKLSDLIKLRSIGKYDNMFNHVNSLPPVPYLGKLTSVQRLDEFHVRKEEGYELRQLGSLRNIGGTLKIMNLENVKDKDEAVQGKLVEKKNLKKLELVWGDSVENASHLEVIEAIQPPSNLQELSIDGYRNSRYPTWLGEGSRIVLNIKSLGLINCDSLTVLPPDLCKSSHCCQLILKNLGAFRDLLNLPECLLELQISQCLIFVCEDELQINNNRGMIEVENRSPSMMQFDELLSLNFADYIQVLLSGEVKIFKRTVSLQTCSEQLRIIEGAAQDDAPEHWENVMRAWWHCQKQRMNFIFSTRRANRLKLPTKLCILNLGYCCISDGALSDCLRGMAALEKLYLEGIMTITTIPPEEVLQSMQSLRVLKIKHCWCLRSLGGLHALTKLENFQMKFCWCLEMESDYTRLPSTLQSFMMRSCVVPQGIFMGNFPCLQNVELDNCHVTRTLSFSQLISIKSLKLFNCPNLCSFEGLKSRIFLDFLWLVGLPSIDVQSVFKSWKGCKELNISSSMMLNELLTSEDFAPPQTLNMFFQHDVVTFEKSGSLQTIKNLGFINCETRKLPTTLRDFSTLEFIYFYNCPNISELPELPDAVQYIEIIGCPVLGERCRPNGLDWDKIQGIQHRWIE